MWFSIGLCGYVGTLQWCPSLRLLILNTLQNIGKSSMFASIKPSTRTFSKKWHVLCISFWRIFYICHVWEHTRWSILEDLHECQKSSTHTVKSVLVQPVETMHNTYFTKHVIFQLLSSVVSKGWSIRMLLPNQSKHMPNHYSLQLCGPPNFHKICNFLCTQITTLTSTLQADTSVWFIQCDEQWGFACWPKYSNHKHCQSGCRQLEPCNTQITQIPYIFHFYLVLSLGAGASGFFCQSQQP